MATVDLAAVDPVAAARSWLLTHPAVTAALGANRVGIRNQPPYPCVMLEDTRGGSDRGLRWLVAPELTIRVLGDLDGTPGKFALRRILYICLAALTELADTPAPPGAPVVTAVESAGAGGWAPEPSGQPCYQAAVRMYMTPSRLPAP